MLEDDDYWRALCAGDRPAVLAVVKRLLADGAGPLDVIERLVVPAQARIGEAWLAGSWSVAREQAATSLNEGLVHWVCSFAEPAGPDRPLVLVGCAEQERHTLPALVVAETLALSGYRVVHEIGDPDPGALLREVLRRKPRAVLLSASLTSSLATLKGLIDSILAIGIPVVVGGRAFGGDERRAHALGATAYAATPADALRLLDELPERLDRVPSAPPGPAEVEAAWIHEYRHQVTPYVVRALARRHLQGGVVPAWWEELEDLVDHLLGCVAASLVTCDETIVVEVRDWLTQVLATRGGTPQLVQEIWQLVAEPLRGHPLARVHLAAGAATVADARSVAPAGTVGPQGMPDAAADGAPDALV
jgi:methanogenic corrinoid protein MtbC1